MPAPAPAAGLGSPAVVRAGALAYAVALAPGDTLVSVELDLAFALAIRPLDPTGAVRAQRRVTLGPPDYDLPGLAIEPAPARAWVASHDGSVRAVALDTGEVTTTWRLGSRTTAVAVSRHGRFVITGTADGVLCLRRAEDGALLQCVHAHDGPVATLAAGPGVLASGSWDGSVTVWTLPALAVRAHRRLPGSVNDLAFDPTGRRLALARSAAPPRHGPDRAPSGTAGIDPAAVVTVWTLAGAAPDLHLRGHRGPVTAVAWTPDGSRLLSTSWDRSVHLWAPRQARLVAQRSGDFGGPLTDLAVDAGGRYIAVSAWSDPETRASPALAVLPLLYPIATTR